MPVSVELEETSKHIIINADWRFKELCKSIPGSGYDAKTQMWKVPVSWSACLALRSTFKTDLEIGPRLTDWASSERSTRVDPANQLRNLEFLPDGEGDQDLFPHQRAGVKFLSTAKRALLADEPGLGKTAQAIRSLKYLQSQGEQVFPALIVCPNTLKKNWSREFKKWWPDSGLNIEIITGTAAQRRKQFDKEDVDVYIINWESLRTHSRLSAYGSIALAKCIECGGHDERTTLNKCEVHKRDLNLVDFKSVIADEMHRSKDPKSKQSRALWAATGDANVRFALTGTPIANNVLDLWAILHWIAPEEWPSKTRWIDRMVDTMLNAFGGMMVLGVKSHMESEFHATVDPRMRRMLKANVLPWLPEMMFERRDVEMSTKQAKAYKQMRDNMIAELESGETLVAASVLTQTTRLSQFASSFAEMVTDESTGEPKAILAEPSCKVDALLDDIKNGDFGDDSVAVCAVSRQLIELLSARLTKEKIPHGLITGAQNEDERQKAVDDFQSGKIKWVLFTAQAGGVGITLTAARRLVMLQRPWSLVDHKQAIDRIHRIGSEIHDSVIVMDYVTEGTIEERVLQVLETKAENFEQIVKDKDRLLDLLKEDKAGKL
jgi:SWI/SNF-related matrix-associated actin-dependent regulator 1 of chromatin subfamily A